MDLARVDDDDHTTHYYYHYPFFPGPLRHSFPQCFRFFPSLSHHSLTHLHRVNICLGPFPLPAFATTFLPLFSFCFRFGGTTPPISLVPSSFHVHPFTLSLSYDYFLLPRICIFLPLTTLTTRASPSFKSTLSTTTLTLSFICPPTYPSPDHSDSVASAIPPTTTHKYAMQVLVIVLVAREVRYIPALPYPVACRFGGLI